MRRKRKCRECDKPLGNTLGRCKECGGENYRAGGTTMYSTQSQWMRQMIGARYEDIVSADEESKKRREEALSHSPRL